MWRVETWRRRRFLRLGVGLWSKGGGDAEGSVACLAASVTIGPARVSEEKAQKDPIRHVLMVVDSMIRKVNRAVCFRL